MFLADIDKKDKVHECAECKNRVAKVMVTLGREGTREHWVPLCRPCAGKLGALLSTAYEDRFECSPYTLKGCRKDVAQ